MSDSKGSVLVIQEQGIPRENFASMLAEKGLTCVWATGEEVVSDVTVQNCVALVTVNKPVDAKMLSTMSGLKVLAVAFTGYGVHDLNACKERKVSVYNVPGYSTDSVAELALGLTLAVLREIPMGDATLRSQGSWAISAGGSELRGKTVGLIGTGTIGLATARLYAAFGCKLIAWSRTEREEFTALGGEYVSSRTELFAAADVVSVHVANNAQTRHMIGQAELEQLKPSAVFINTARGQIVDQKVLSTMLHEGKFRAGLDVYESEPLSMEDPLRSVPASCVITPHVAYKTREALTRRAAITIGNIVNGLNEEDTNRVA